MPLRNKLIAVFLAATLVPLAATVWIARSLLEHSLSYATTEELDRLSKTLEETAREFYQKAREDLKAAAQAGRISPRRHALAERDRWPSQVAEFWASGEGERFALSGGGGDRLEYLVRRDSEVWAYSAPLGRVRMEEITAQYRRARELVEAARARDLRRGLLLTLVVMAAAVWVVSLGALVYVAHRISRPIQQLTAGLGELAAGRLETRLKAERDDEVGRAIRAFNETAEQLQQSRQRLVYLTRIASWQVLARKMAHELKNSLTPVRLTMEELLARQTGDRALVEQAARIVVEEVEGLERRVRAFSEFAAEPPVRLAALDVNALVEERVALLKAAHSEVEYRLNRMEGVKALADEDRVKGILTNLLENAAEAAGPGGAVLAMTAMSNGKAVIEVHDSGPGLSEAARQSLFEPTISFKARGMGLGLSIARKNALVCGGDILLVNGELGGAGFRVVLPAV